MAMCSDVVINPVPKPSAKTTKKVKVRCRNNPYSDECDFMMRFWEACSSHGARTFDRESQNYIICCSKEDAFVYSFPAISDYGAFIPYFPDEQSANAVIEEVGMENLAKYYFNRKDDYKWNLPF